MNGKHELADRAVDEGHVYEVMAKATYTDVLIVKAKNAKAARAKAFKHYGSLTIPFSELDAVHIRTTKM